MSVRLLSSPDELHSISEQWRRLAGGVPMRGPDWLLGWLRHYQAVAGEAFVVSAWRGDELVALAPWRREHSARSGRVVRWLGDGEVCTDHLGLLTAVGDGAEAVDEIADWLIAEAEHWDLIELDHTDEDDSPTKRLFNSLGNRDCPATTERDDACWTIDLPADWEEYLARQSKSHRKQLRRAERRVLDSSQCVWRLVESASDLEHAWPILIDLHQRRRNSLDEPGCFASQRFADFHAELARVLLERDQLRVSWLELDGRPAAVEHHFAGPQAIYAYQGGVDPDRLEEEPGRLSTIATLQHAMQQGQTVFDFLRGDEPYKAHWRAEPQYTVRYRAASPRRGARLRAQANQAADSLTGVLKSSLQSLRG